MQVTLQLTPEVRQQLNLAPQLLHWLRLLQLPTHELSSLVRTELERNPVLSLDESDGDAFRTEENIGEAEALASSVGDAADEMALWRETAGSVLSDHEEPLDTEEWDPNRIAEAQDYHRWRMESVSRPATLHEELLRQLGTEGLSREDRRLAELIVGSLDANGYLVVPLEELAGEVPMPLDRAEHVLRRVQTLAPPGVAARNLKECLLLQMNGVPANDLARRIVECHLEALSRSQYRELARTLGVPVREVLRARDRILQLDPRPGRTLAFSGESFEAIPDVEVFPIDGQWRVELCREYAPRLRISAACRQLLEASSLTPEEHAYLRERLRSAQFFIQGIRRREETLRRVMEEIVRFQRDFLEKPGGEIRPLTMARIAAILKVHETTVSRAIANKFVKTPRGTFPIKTFFRSGYTSADGSAHTPEVIKRLVRELLEGEDPEHPVRDKDIQYALRQKGITLARRTIAKYRTELGYSNSKERRSASGPLKRKPCSRAIGTPRNAVCTAFPTLPATGKENQVAVPS